MGPEPNSKSVRGTDFKMVAIFSCCFLRRFWGRKRREKRRKKVRGAPVLSFLFILLLRSCRTQIIVAILLLYYHYNIVLKSRCPARVLLSRKSPECWPGILNASKELTIDMIILLPWTLFHACQFCFVSDYDRVQTTTGNSTDWLLNLKSFVVLLHWV